MARIFMDGFETGDSSLWTTTSGASIVSSNFPAGFSGTYYLYHGSGGYYLEKTLPTSKSELYFAFKYYIWTGIYAEVIGFKDSAGTMIGSLVINGTTMLIEFRAGNILTTVLATGTTQIISKKAYLIEIYYKPLNSGGVCTVKVDGVQNFTYSGDTTGGLENIQTIKTNSLNGNNSSGTYIDDFVIDDSNWIGNTKVGIIVPDGTGTTNNWTASAGNAWDCLNEIPPVDTDYAYSNTTNQIATYAMTTIANMNTVKSIQLQGRAAYEGSPTPTKIQLGVRATGADYFATDLSPGISFGMLTKILELNPADSAAFEQADIDALEVGVKAVA